MEPLEKEGDEKVSEDAPKEEAKETEKEEVQSSVVEVEKKKEEVVVVTQRVIPAKRTKAATPYGVWEQIQEEKDP